MRRTTATKIYTYNFIINGNKVEKEFLKPLNFKATIAKYKAKGYSLWIEPTGTYYL